MLDFSRCALLFKGTYNPRNRAPESVRTIAQLSPYAIRLSRLLLFVRSGKDLFWLCLAMIPRKLCACLAACACVAALVLLFCGKPCAAVALRNDSMRTAKSCDFCGKFANFFCCPVLLSCPVLHQKTRPCGRVNRYRMDFTAQARRAIHPKHLQPTAMNCGRRSYPANAEHALKQRNRTAHTAPQSPFVAILPQSKER